MTMVTLLTAPKMMPRAIRAMQAMARKGFTPQLFAFLPTAAATGMVTELDSQDQGSGERGFQPWVMQRKLLARQGQHGVACKMKACDDQAQGKKTPICRHEPPKAQGLAGGKFPGPRTL